MADGLVQVPPDSSGKKIDTSEIVTSIGTVERQRINVADPLDPNQIATVQQSQLSVKEPDVRDLLVEILMVLQDINDKLG